MQGAAVKATLFTTGLGSTTTFLSYTLSGAEADAITDYSDLRLRVTCNVGNYSGTMYVDRVEFEVP